MMIDIERPSLQSLDALFEFHILKALDLQQRYLIQSNCRWLEHAPGDEVIGVDSDSTDVYFILNGSVRVIIRSSAGREVVLDTLQAGQYFGELSGIDSRPRSATIEAFDHCRLASVPAETFHKAVLANPEACRRLLFNLSTVIRKATSRITDVSTLWSHGRVHKVLLKLADRNVASNNSARIDPMPARRDIAGLASTAPETVSRVLRKLEDDGVVHRRGDHLFLPDIEDLRRIAELDGDN